MATNPLGAVFQFAGDVVDGIDYIFHRSAYTFTSKEGKEVIKSHPLWGALLTFAAIAGGITTLLGLYKSLFPRKYEFQSRDYTKRY